MGFAGTILGAVSLRLKASTRSTDLLDVMKQSCRGDKKLFLLQRPGVASFLSTAVEESTWPEVFCQLILGQLSLEYANKGKTLDSEDTLIVIQAVGYALSQWYPNDQSVQNFLSSLPFDV